MKTHRARLHVFAAMFVAGAAHATNGYLTDGVGTKNEALAGAGSADPEEAMILATNPAGIALVDPRIEAGIGLFSPDRSYSTSASLAQGHGGAFTIGPNQATSSNQLFPLPFVASNWRLDPQDTVGAAFYARGGMNTTWEGGSASFAPGPGAPVRTFPGVYGDGTAGVDLMQAFLNLSFAHSFSDRRLAVGASAILAVQRFDARGLANFAPYTETFAASGGTVMPVSLSNNGADVSAGGGFAVGVEWQPVPMFGAAASFTSKMFMSRFSSYADLFAGHGSFDIPANGTIGVTLRPAQPLAISFDVQEIWYDGVSAVGNPIGNLFACPTAGAGGTSLSSCLGGTNGAGFGWRDMTVLKLGLRWQIDSNWTGRFGVSHGTQPIPDSQVTFNILAPGVVQDHFAVGFTRRDGDRGEYNVALTYAASKAIRGYNSFDPTQTIELQMHQFNLEFGYAWNR